MFDKRIYDNFDSHHFSPTQFLHRRDPISEEKIDRPIDSIVFNNGDGKDYPELFKIDDEALLDENMAN